MRPPLIAILCSGQGGQHRDMFAVSGQAEEAQAIFQQAAPWFDGVDPRDFVRTAPPDSLYSNRTGQLLCCVQALAAWAALGPMRPARAILAGYSIGELAAWGCAGALPVATVLELAAARAQAMDAAAPPDSGMLAVVGLDRATLAPWLARGGAWIAIVNDVDHFVLAGDAGALSAIQDDARRAGARRVAMLHVAVPSHSPLLAVARDRYAERLATVQARLPTPQARLLSGIDGEPVRAIGPGLDKLAAQISQSLDWSACLDSCIDAGAVAALELGPGDALCRMWEGRCPERAARAVDHFRHPQGLREWLDRVYRDSGR